MSCIKSIVLMVISLILKFKLTLVDQTTYEENKSDNSNEEMRTLTLTCSTTQAITKMTLT